MTSRSSRRAYTELGLARVAPWPELLLPQSVVSALDSHGRRASSVTASSSSPRPLLGRGASPSSTEPADAAPRWPRGGLPPDPHCSSSRGSPPPLRAPTSATMELAAPTASAPTEIVAPPASLVHARASSAPATAEPGPRLGRCRWRMRRCEMWRPPLQPASPPVRPIRIRRRLPVLRAEAMVAGRGRGAGN